MQTPFPSLRANHGFTLVEVMLALVIFGIGILSIVALQARNMAYNSSARRQTQGYAWAVDRVERLRALPYGHADLNVTGNPHADSVKVDGNTMYSLKWMVTDNAANVPDTKKIDVTIQWNGRDVSNLTFIRTQSAI